MRIFLGFLIGVWIQWIPLAQAQQGVVVGRVVSVDREAGILTIRVIDASVSAPEGSEEAPGIVPQEMDNEITVAVDQGRIPGEIRPKAVVRLWGEFSEPDRHFLAGEVVVQRGRGTGSDPTGVRRRLGGGRGAPGFNGGRGGGHAR